MLLEFWENFRHNLFKPLLLFFYLGFLIPILKVQFEFPYVVYQGVTMYLSWFRGFVGSVSLVSRGLLIEIVLGERTFRRRVQ